MYRHCDGTDPNLRKVESDPETGEEIELPCDCGLIFDDVNRLVFFPHERF